MTTFPFSDLHGFKDYIVFIQTCLPDRFLPREGFGPDEQWTLDLAFEGLRYGLELAVEEKGIRPVFLEARKLIDNAYDDYRNGRPRGGFYKLEELQRLLKAVPTQ